MVMSTRMLLMTGWQLARPPNGMIAVRDSKLGEGSPVLQFTQREWDAFRLGIADGEFDLL
jgi:Domain of unknown function (DUF397)